MNNSISSKEKSGTPQRWQVLITCFVSYFYDCFDLVVLSIAMPVLTKVLDISLSQGGLLASASMIGAAVGSILFGVVAENKGRKSTLILCLAWFGIGTIMIYLVHTWGQWMILRFVTGLGIGGVFGPTMAIVSKHWHKHYRARANSFILSTFAIGAIFAALLGRLVLTIDWRILFLIGSTSIIIAIIDYFAIPSDIEEKSTQTVKKEKIGVSTIFKSGMAKTTIFATLISVSYMGGYWGVGTWVPTYLIEVRGLDLATMANFSIIMYIGMFIGFQAWAYIADRIGRKKVIALSFLFDVVSISMYLLIPSGTFLFWWGAVVGFGFSGVAGVMGAYYNELFPDKVQAYASGFCFNVGRLGSVIAPYTVGLIGQYFGLTAGLAITPVVCATGLIFIAFLPETMKKEIKDKNNAV